MLGLLKKIHHKYVFLRRINVLSSAIAEKLPDNISVLDVGCGDGTISALVMRQKKGVSYEGIDIMARPQCAIPYRTFDGSHIPYEDSSVDAVQFVDVLHHTLNIRDLLAEAVRTSKKFVVIKDHEYSTGFDYQVLKFMDWVGNAPHGVKVIYNFKPRKFWTEMFKELNLEIVEYSNKVPLYPFPFNLLFGRRLHFVAVLQINRNKDF
jgi:ubiquinone/menaquinone biosynthesis C-methylase UbiE